MNWHTLFTVFILTIFCALLLTPKSEAASLINVPLKSELSDFNRETYRFIQRLLNKRVLPGIARGSLPLTRKQVVSYLLEAYKKQENGEITLSAIDQERLNALLAFYREARANFLNRLQKKAMRLPDKFRPAGDCT